MSDALLATTDIEEALSRAYVHAISAAAGYTVAHADFDRDGIDVTFAAGGVQRPKLDAQLKATINLGLPSAGNYHYACPVRNYNLLRIPTQTPRVLIVLQLPTKPEEWLNVSQERLVLRQCAYWTCLLEADATKNEATTTVHLPEANRFNIDSLRWLMEQSRNGKIPP